jgi:hypothetical protein
MATREEMLAALRARNPSLADLSDTEIEAITGRSDPRLRDFFDQARGALPPSGLEAPPDPSQYDAGGGIGAAATTLNTMRDVGLAREVPKLKVPTAEEALEGGIASIPAVSGTIGGIAAVPAAAAGGVATGGGAAVPIEMLGSGGMGAAGEGLRQWIQEKRGKESLTPEQKREAIAKEFVIQSTIPAVTVPIKAGARYLYKGALDAGANVLNRFDINRLVERGLEEKILASRGGGAKAGELLAESGERSKQIARAADARGVAGVFSTEMRPGLDEPLNKAINEWTPSESLDILAKKESDLLTARTTPRSMVEMERAVREGNIRSADAYAAASKLGGSPGVAAQADKALTDRGRQLLEQRVPEIVPEKQKASELLGITKLLKSKKEPSPLNSIDLGVGTLTGAAGVGALGPYGAILGPLAIMGMKGLRSPFGRSVAAQVTEHAGVPLTRAGAELVRYRDALLRLLGTQDDQQQTPPTP